MSQHHGNHHLRSEAKRRIAARMKFSPDQPDTAEGVAESLPECADEALTSSFSDAVISSAPGIFFVVNQQSRLVRWNAGLSNLTELSDDELREAVLGSLVLEDSRAPIADKFAVAFATGSAQGTLCFKSKSKPAAECVFSASRFQLAGDFYVASFCLDATESMQLESALTREKNISDTIIESASGAFFMIDQKTNLVRWNHYLRMETGLSDEQLLGRSIVSLIYEPDQALAAAKFMAAFAGGFAHMEVRLQTPDRGIRYSLKTARRFMVDGVPYLAGFCIDVTDRKTIQDALGKEKAFSDALIESVPGAFYVVDMECNYYRWNNFLKRMTGLSDGELLQRPSLLSIEEADRPMAAVMMKDAFETGYAQADLSLATVDGGVRLYSMTARRFQVADETYLVGVGIDNTEWLAKMQELEHVAWTDPLTRVVNRGHFLELASLEFARSRRYGNPLTVWVVDIDHFKKVNDTYGHQAGDLVLQSMVSISRQALRDWDILGRIGGEEFAVLLPETEATQGLLVAERLRQAVATSRMPLEKLKAIQLTVSIGIATLCDSDADFNALFHRADTALYEAKRTGRDKVCLAEPLPSTAEAAACGGVIEARVPVEQDE